MRIEESGMPRTRLLPGVLLALGLLASGASQPAPFANGQNLNGSNLNGSNLNGSNLNGHNQNGVNLNGVSVNGVAFNGTSLNALTLVRYTRGGLDHTRTTAPPLVLRANGCDRGA